VKANIMLTLAAVVTTFSIGYLTDPLLRWPVIVLILFCVATVFFAAYAVMPKLDFDFQPNIDEPNCNVLFFGNFMNLDYEGFSEIMANVMQAPEKVYEAQIREVYELGVYLGHQKYRYVRLAYLTFLSGLLASGATFVLVEILQFLG
jgi:hypothetical protein